MLRTLLATSLLLAACAPAKDAPESVDPGSTPVVPVAAEPAAPAISNSPTSIATATFASTLGINIAEFEHNEAGLYWKDRIVGTGQEAKIGSQVSVKYDGKFPNGSAFESGTFPFTVGARQVIDGWDQGIKGMKVGGKRTLIIPASLAYGPAANGKIPANATLVFEVELLEVQ
ncbi:MAG: FKBP-type peptidyl-prolyl cis-trans isomerase [Gemmatimonadota bacterium]